MATAPSSTRRHYPTSPLILTPIDVEALDAKFSSLADQWDTISQCSNRPRVDHRSASYCSGDDDDDDDDETGRGGDGKQPTAWIVSFDNDNGGGDNLPNHTYDDKDDWDDESLTTAATSVAGDYQVDYTGWDEEAELAVSSVVKKEEEDVDIEDKGIKGSLEEQKLNDQRIVEEMESESDAIDGDLLRGVGEEEDDGEGIGVVDEEKKKISGHYCFNEELWMVKTTPEMERLAQKMKEQDRRLSRDSSLETTEHMTSSDDSDSEKEPTIMMTTTNVVDEDDHELVQKQEDEDLLEEAVKEPEHLEEEVTLLTKEFSRDDDEPAVDLLEDDDDALQEAGIYLSGNLAKVPGKEEGRGDMKVEESREVLHEEGTDILELPVEELVASPEKKDDERAQDDTMETTEMVLSDEDEDELDGLLDELLDADVPMMETTTEMTITGSEQGPANEKNDASPDEEATGGETSIVFADFYSNDSVLFLCRGLSQDLDSDEIWEQGLVFHDAAMKIQYWWLDLAIKQALRQTRQMDLDIDQALHASMQPKDSATIIQSFCRMVLAKRVLQGLKANKTKVLSATRIQAFYHMIIAQRTRRSFQVKKLQVVSAIRVQALYRVVKAKRVYQSKKDEKYKLTSATKLQSMCRMVMARRIRQSLETEQVEARAAMQIQSRNRVIVAKKTSKLLMDEKLKGISATKIQSFCRFYMAQRIDQLMQNERPKVLICTDRGPQEETMNKIEIHATIRIQSVWRMTSTKKQSQGHRQEERLCRAAMKIQRFARQAFGKIDTVPEEQPRKYKQQEQQHVAALKLQFFARVALVKMAKAKREAKKRDKLEQQLKAVVRLQRFARETLVKVKTTQTIACAQAKEDPHPSVALVKRGEEGTHSSTGEKEDTQDSMHLSKPELQTTHSSLLENDTPGGTPDASSLSAPESKVFFGMQKLVIGPEGGPDSTNCVGRLPSENENSDRDLTDEFLADIEGLQTELDSVYSKQPKTLIGEDGDSWGTFEEEQEAPLSPRSEGNEESCRVHIEQLEMVGKEKKDQKEDNGEKNTQVDIKLPPNSTRNASKTSSAGDIAPGDFPLLSSNWFDKYKDDCLWDEESVLSANTTASAPAQTASFWDDKSVSSAHTAATAPVPRDLVISVYTQRAEQLTDEEVYAGAMQAVALAKEIESLMAKAKKRQPRRKRQRMGFFRARRRTNEIQKQAKQICNKKCERRRQNETKNKYPQPRAGIRGRLSRMFRRGKENPPGTPSETDDEVKVKQGVQCRAETLLTE